MIHDTCIGNNKRADTVFTHCQRDQKSGWITRPDDLSVHAFVQTVAELAQLTMQQIQMLTGNAKANANLSYECIYYNYYINGNTSTMNFMLVKVKCVDDIVGQCGTNHAETANPEFIAPE